MNHNDIVLSDYRGYIVDINFEVYFKEQLSQCGKINNVFLNPAGRSYCQQFMKELEK